MLKEFEEEEIDHFDNAEMEEFLRKKLEIEKEINAKGWHHFSRREPRETELSKDFEFMQIDCDYTFDENKKCVVRMFGITQEGNSVMIYVEDFLSYFYIQMPYNLNITSQQQSEQFRQEFNKQLQGQRNMKNEREPIVSIQVCQKESIRNYKGPNQMKNFLKIYCQSPQYVSSIRNWLRDPRQIQGINIDSQTYESNMPYALRFMIDKNIVGMGWVKLIGNQYKKTNDFKKLSFCQIELVVKHEYIEAISTEQQPILASLRVLSFDIECAAQKGFPHAANDPVIQIGCIVKYHDQADDYVRVVFTYKECEQIPGSIVKSYNTETELLQQFQLFLQALDPDIITGYNIQNFDFPYLLDRAKYLKINDFGRFSRILMTQSKQKDGKFLSKVMGMRDTKEINIEGRIQIDMMMHMLREHKLSSISLNNVSFIFLKQQKEDLHHSIIYDLQYGNRNKDGGNPETRKRIAVYCLKDAQLPLNLIDKLMCIYNYAEMARVTGVPINYLFMRGQQIKVASMLYRKAMIENIVIPTENFTKNNDQTYEGATVLDPQQGFYEDPIATLDFASLYPSIMMAHNLCYSTLINSQEEARRLNLKQEDYIISPEISAIFVKAHLKKGLLPQILNELIQARKFARSQLANTQDPKLRAVLDGRQLALKISANSVYGFTGAQIGQLPCLQISATVTAFGRKMIDYTKRRVEELYDGSKVIYGDTDSVMVKFKINKNYENDDQGKKELRREVMRLGKEAADIISQEFDKPIKLEFEKVYHPYLLLNRKRYAGLYWTNENKYDKIDTKGIETVRRDNCNLIRTMLKEILELILVKNDKLKAVNYTKQLISDLYQGKIDISDLVITKSLNLKSGGGEEEKDKKQGFNKEKKDLTKSYKQKQAHTFVAEKMQQRDETNAPAAGDRIPYIIIQGMKGSKNYENAEDPIEVLKKDLPIDYDYYVNNQLKKPLIRIFEHVIQNPESLFIGEHTKIRFIPKLGQNALMGKFIKKILNCFNCKATVEGNSPLCQNCESKSIDIISQKIQIIQQIEKSYHELWVQCQRCAGNTHTDIICQNRDCNIFYKRTKMMRQLQEKYEEMERFEGW